MKTKKKGKSTGKKYGEKTLIGRNPLLPVVHACTRGNTFGVTSLPVGLSVMHNGTTTTVVVQNVPVVHAHAITSGSTTSHIRLCNYIYTTHIQQCYSYIMAVCT